MDILIDFGVPIITALISYLVAIKTQNTKLKETKLILEKEMETIEKNHEIKIKELEMELELQQKSKEHDVIFDFAKDFMGRAMKDPTELQKIKTLSEEMDKIKDFKK